MRSCESRTKSHIGVAITLATLFGAMLAQSSISADSAVNAPASGPRPLALVGPLIRTQSSDGDMIATIVIKDGRIVALGKDVVPPADAERINLDGFVVTPGLIDARSTLWLNAGTARENGRDASLNIIDGIDPFANDWRDVAKHGVTAVYVQPHSGGSLGGGGAVLRVAPASKSDDMVLRHPAGVQAALGVAGAAPAPTANPLAELLARLGLPAPPIQPAAAPTGSNALTRYAQFESLRSQFDAAKKYGDNKPAQKEPAKELLLRVLSKEIPVRLEVSHEDDVRNAMKLGELGARVVFERLDRVHALPEELLNASNAIVIGPFIGGKDSADLRKLSLDGRRMALGTFGEHPRDSSSLRVHAARAANQGFPRDRLLQAMTKVAAELLGVGDRLGQLQVGRPADLVVFAGDPLDPSTEVRLTICQGQVTFANAKVAPTPVIAAVAPKFPDEMPTKFVLKTNRLLNEAGELAPGEISIRGNVVTSVNSREPDAIIIDLGDAVVSRGLFSGQLVTSDESTSDPDAGHLNAGLGIHDHEKKIRGSHDAGFNSLLATPGSRNVLAGLIADASTEGQAAPKVCGFKFVLTSAARSNERYPACLAGEVELIRQRLAGAPSSTQLYLPNAVNAALLAEREKNLALVRQREVPAFFDANTSGEITAALELIKEFRLRGVLIMPRQLDHAVDDIRSSGAAVVVGPLRATDDNKLVQALVQLIQAGVPAAFGGGDAMDIRSTAALLANAGAPRAAVRRILGGGDAKAFGCTANRLVVQPGMPVTELVVWDGDLLDPGAKAHRLPSPYQRSGPKPAEVRNAAASGLEKR